MAKKSARKSGIHIKDGQVTVYLSAEDLEKIKQAKDKASKAKKAK